MKTEQFITAFHHEDLEPNIEVENHCKEIKLEDVKEHNTSFFEENQEQLAKLFIPVVKDFWKEVGIMHGYTSFRLKHLWIQQYNPGHSHRLHIHSPLKNEWSFVYYVDCNEDSANTVFYNFGYPYVDHHHFKIKPKKGRCVLFPGALPHEAEPNVENSRLVISGNMAFDK